jgi:RNA polymerase sigma-70 factor (ECF subfamily)
MAPDGERLQADPTQSADSDELLVRRFGDGDESVFDTIVRGHCTEVAALANRLLGWPGDVDDVVQDVFLAAYVGLKKFRCQSSLKTWLFTITINRCRRYCYKRMLRQRALLKNSRNASGAVADALDKPALSKETFSKVQRAVRALPVKYRAPIVLRHLQELSMKEASDILGITVNALQVRLSRARKRLKDDLAELLEE